MLLTQPRAQVFCLTLPLILFLSLTCFGQANVNESLETATVYVDGVNGSDSNPGTSAEPLKTIGAGVSKAVNNNHNSIGTKVIIRPATYRESIAVGHSGKSTSLPMTFEAATNGTVIVSGADVWTGWTQYSGNSQIYTRSWPYSWGVCRGDPQAPTEQPIVMRREMLIVNHKPMTEVLSLSAMRPGTFFPSESNSTVYVWPPSGANMSTATVEVATRDTLFTVGGQSNIVVRGLTFEYANSCHQSAAVSIVNRAQNVLMDSDTFIWNNAAGLVFNGGAQKFTVQNSVANHNGQMGFGTSTVKSGLWQSDTTSYNNWRGAQGAFYSWDTGGTKFLLDHDSTFSNFTTAYNQAHGFAFDTDNKNVTLTNFVSVSNVGTGFYAEKGEGPFTFTNSAICANNIQNNAYLGGITLRDSAGVSLTGSSLFGNGTAQVYLIGQAGGFLITDWETGQVYNVLNENLKLSGTTLAGPASYQVFSDGTLGGADWTHFVSTLSSDNNTWWAGANKGAFTVPSPTKNTNVTLGGWQSMTTQDSHSTWTSANSPAACNVASKGADFWLLMMTNTAHPITVDSSGTASWNLATLPLGGMTGTVNLSLDGVSKIPGTTASFTPASISTSAASVLTVHTGANTPAGTYPVTVIANLGNITHTVTISVAVPTTSVHLSTNSLSFGNQKDGTSSSPKTVTLTNTGKVPLVMTGISSNPVFSQTNNCGLSVAAGKSCTINVTFTPKAVGAVTQSLRISDADPTSPQSVTLTGTGLAAPHLSLSVKSLSFGLHKVGTTGTKTLTLTNKGTGPLAISKMTITGTNSADFTQSNNCGTSLAASKACTVTVAFKPHATGSRSAVLSIFDNDAVSASPQTVTLAGSAN
jgi:hypothetical protein